MAAHKIVAVNPQTRPYDSRYGPMIAYSVLFEDMPGQAVEISQKDTTPAPEVGQVLEGSIDMSGQYGPKFKKDYNTGGGGGGFQQKSASVTQTAPSSDKGKFDSDPFTMYLSYAKDVAVALLETTGGLDGAKLTAALELVAQGGHFLYDKRPGATNATAQAVKDVFAQPTVEPDIPELPWPTP